MQKYISKYIKWGLLIIILFPLKGLMGQQMNNTLYMMQNVPQSHYLNPSIQPECKVMVGFPGLSSVYLNYSNSSFSYQDIIHKGSGLRKDSLVVDINKFHDALQTTNFLSQQMDLSILSLGIRAKKMFFTLDIIEKNDIRFNFNKEMITFLKDGNFDYRGKTSNWGGLGLDATHYREIALGVSKKIDDRWSVGVKGKLLFGIANLNMEDSDMSVFTSKTGDQILLRSKQLMNVSMPIHNINYDDDGFVDDLDFDGDDLGTDFALNTQNKGFALDLGMNFRMDEKTTLYASIIDLGFINWKSDTYQFSQDASFDYKGGDWSQSGNSNAPDYKDIEDVMEDLTDSIADRFRIEDAVGSYRTNLPAKIYLGGSYKVSKKVNLAALTRTEIYNSKIHSSLTLSANARLIKNISTSVSYSILNNTYNNIGVGLATKLGPLQMYMVSDNIMAAVNPRSAQSVNFRFGLNLLFGCRDKTKLKTSCNMEEKIKDKKPLYQ